MSPGMAGTGVDDLISALIRMDRIAIREILSPGGEAAEKNEMVENLIVPALEEIGRRWQDGSLAISQVYMAGILIEEVIGTLFPESDLKEKNPERIATVVLEDYHMLGERIVSTHLIGSGYSPVRYGRKDVEELVALVKADKIRYLVISTLMLPSALRIREVSNRLAGEGVKIIVGGAPFRYDPELGPEVGADRVCFTASDAVLAIRDLEAGR